MAVSSNEYTKTALTPEGMRDAIVNIKIAEVLIESLGDSLSPQEKASKQVTLARDLFSSHNESPLDQVKRQVSFLENIGQAISSVEKLGKDVISGAIELLMKSKAEAKKAIEESEKNRKLREETIKIPELEVIFESNIDQEVRIELLKALNIQVSEVCLHLQEINLSVPDPLRILAQVSLEEKRVAKKDVSKQIPAIAESVTNTSHVLPDISESESDAITKAFDKFYGTSKRVITAEELKGGRYPLDLAPYELLRKFVLAKNHRISKTELRRDLKTFYFNLTQKLASVIQGTELKLHDNGDYLSLRISGDFDPSQPVKKFAGKTIIEGSPKEEQKPKKRGPSKTSALTNEFIQTGISEEARSMTEIVAVLMENPEISKRYERQTVNIAVYNELARLLKLGKVQRTGEGKSRSPYKFSLIEETDPEKLVTIDLTSEEQLSTEGVLIEEEPKEAEPVELPAIPTPDTSSIEDYFETIGYVPPSPEKLANVQMTGVYGGRFEALFKNKANAIDFIKTNMHRPGYEKYADFFKRHFGESILSGAPTTKTTVELEPLVISLRTDRKYSSGEALAELKIHVKNKSVTIKTPSGFDFNKEVPVEIYPSEDHPNVWVGFALSQKGSSVLDELKWKAKERTVVMRAIGQIIESLSQIAFGNDMNAEHVKRPIHPGMMVYKVKMPNAPRIYFTLGNSTKNGTDRLPENRHLVIWAVTDHANEDDTLTELVKEHRNKVKMSTR